MNFELHFFMATSFISSSINAIKNRIKNAQVPEVFLAIFFVETPETLISPQAACIGAGPLLKL